MNEPRVQTPQTGCETMMCDEKRPCSPCQAGPLSIDSNQVSGRVPVPGTSLLTGCTGSCLSPRHMHFPLHHNGHFGASSEPGKGSLNRPAVSDTRGPGPPVSDTASLKHPAGARAERLERPVSDTSLPGGAPVSDTSTMATATDDDITIYVASAGVQNAEMMAGMAEPSTLPRSNNSKYYDEPRYSERCETVRVIAQGDRAELIDCRGPARRSLTAPPPRHPLCQCGSKRGPAGA